ncbi:MAG TPA: sigma-70 family RNA polymerase sigma factor [Solirubrobacteraceae bacterium]|nr:sigma-70 family RNA polymerase sigma factor [Solirubrobacteraceae bacterium]
MEVSALTHPTGLGHHGRSPWLRLQSDEQLIRLVRAGSDPAFETLVDRYRPRLLAFCRHLLRSSEDAEDILQEAFAAAYRAIHADDRPIQVRGWLYRIARNRCLNHLRRTPAVGLDSMDVLFAEHGESVADKVHRREEFRLLMNDIRGLAETQRTALILREMEALSYEDIAEAMETTVPSVKSLLVRARVALAEASEARALSCEQVRLELGEVAEGLLARAGQPVRRHLRGCERCQAFQGHLRQTNRRLAAFAPLGPFALWRSGLFSHAGSSSGAGASGLGASSGAGIGGVGAGVSWGSLGVGALATKAVASLAAAALLTAGAVVAENDSAHAALSLARGANITIPAANTRTHRRPDTTARAAMTGPGNHAVGRSESEWESTSGRMASSAAAPAGGNTSRAQATRDPAGAHRLEDLPGTLTAGNRSALNAASAPTAPTPAGTLAGASSGVSQTLGTAQDAAGSPTHSAPAAGTGAVPTPDNPTRDGAPSPATATGAISGATAGTGAAASNSSGTASASAGALTGTTGAATSRTGTAGTLTGTAGTLTRTGQAITSATGTVSSPPAGTTLSGTR